ncbi:MAG: DUF6291 domain-containing protein [Fibrobacter sp.]|nr:DUF6291 domain-containing protein [Fibrobacter sp.]
MYESYVFYTSFHEACKDLEPSQYGKIMYVLNEYALNGVVPESFEDPIVKMAYTFMRPQIDANNQRKDNGKYGAMGGRPKTHHTKKENPNTENNNPMGFENEEKDNPMGFENSENKNPNVNVNANVNVNVNANADIAAEAAKPAEPAPVSKPKKLPLREREPDNELEAVEKAYLQQWDELYKAEVVQTPEPPSGMWTECRAHIKQHLKNGVTVDQMILAVRKAASDSWVLRGGFLLKTILSSGVFNRLVNGYETPPEKINGNYILENDRALMQNADKFFAQNEKTKARFMAEYAPERQVPNEIF